jgi:peptidoglycan/xylan/chitin deacetylase (PgdA/CDA1 family)
MDNSNGTALMFHSIGQNYSNWIRKYLSSDLVQFEILVKHISKKYKALTLDEWIERENNRDKKDVLLTFDDGYLDNWSLALPILEKYEVKGTVFVNPEFIDKKSDVLRPQFFESTKKWKLNYNKSSLGFMNEFEIKACDKSGFLAVESHSMSHNFVFISDIVLDFYNGQEK